MMTPKKPRISKGKGWKGRGGSTVRNLHEGCDQGGETEALDDDGSEVGDAAIWNVADDSKEEK